MTYALKMACLLHCACTQCYRSEFLHADTDMSNGPSSLAATGCEDSLMPHGGLRDDLSDPRDLERHNEEVRLLYVGMTRAKQQLHLMHAQKRALRGGMQRLDAEVSPFLQSIPGVDLSKQASQLGWQNTQGYMQMQSEPAGSTYDAAHKPSRHVNNLPPMPTPPCTPAQLRASRRRR